MQPDRFQTAAFWMGLARQDLDLAGRLTTEMPNVACFHAQQAAEKALKAALVARDGDVAREHSVVRLLLDCTNRRPDDGLLDDARRLDKFYTSSRYPDALGGLDPISLFGASEAREAADRATTLVDFARDIVAAERSRD